MNISDKIKDTLLKVVTPFELVGFLNGNLEMNELSDIDVFLLGNSKIPSDYFKNCEVVCSALMDKVPGVFIFSSFKQQILLHHAAGREYVGLHFLQYLSVSHLVIREVNTLPKFVSECIETVKINEGIFDKIRLSYDNRNDLLNSNVIRIFYYFDILNEIAPIIYNTVNNQLPFSLIQCEVLHKLKFILCHLGFELLSHNHGISQDAITLNQMDNLLREKKLDYLVNQKNDIVSVLGKNQKLNLADLKSMIKSTYKVFDDINVITGSL